MMVASTVFEAATLRRSLLVTCSCGHSSRFEARTLWWQFERRSWDQQLGTAKVRFWCRVCRASKRQKVRPRKIEVVDWAEGDFELQWPDEREWKRAVQRVR